MACGYVTSQYLHGLQVAARQLLKLKYSPGPHGVGVVVVVVVVVGDVVVVVVNGVVVVVVVVVVNGVVVVV